MRSKCLSLVALLVVLYLQTTMFHYFKSETTPELAQSIDLDVGAISTTQEMLESIPLPAYASTDKFLRDRTMLKLYRLLYPKAKEELFYEKQTTVTVSQAIRQLTLIATEFLKSKENLQYHMDQLNKLSHMYSNKLPPHINCYSHVEIKPGLPHIQNLCRDIINPVIFNSPVLISSGTRRTETDEDEPCCGDNVCDEEEIEPSSTYYCIYDCHPECITNENCLRKLFYCDVELSKDASPYESKCLNGCFDFVNSYVAKKPDSFSNRNEGVGAELIRQQFFTSFALHTKLKVVFSRGSIDGDWLYGSAATCGDKKAWWRCLFAAPFTVLVDSEEDLLLNMTLADFEPIGEPKLVLQSIAQEREADWSCRWVQNPVEWRMSLSCVDEAVVGADVAFSLLHTVLLFLQPRKQTYQQIKSSLQRLGLHRGDYIAVHLRGTDKWSEAYNQRLISPEEFAPAILKMMALKQTHNVYIATDDNSYSKQRIHRSLVELARQSSYSYKIEGERIRVILPESVSRSEHEQAETVESLNTIDQARRDGVGVDTFGSDTFRDLFALAEASGMIGTHYSTFSVVAILLGIGLHGMDSYYYVDMPDLSYAWHPSKYHVYDGD